MRTQLLLTSLAAFLVIGPAASAEVETRSPVPAMRPGVDLPDSALLHGLVARIEAADRIYAYRLLGEAGGDCLPPNAETSGCFHGDLVVRRWSVTPGEWRNRLSQLLADPRSYVGSEKLCICDVDFALRFAGASSEVDVLLCFGCDTITLTGGSTTISGFIDTIPKQVREIVAAVLPADIRFANGLLVGPVIARADDFPGAQTSNRYDSPPTLVWTDETLKRALEGPDSTLTLLRVLVGQDGRVKAIKSMGGRQPAMAEASALGRSIVFKPALRANRPVWTWIDMRLPLSWESPHGDSVRVIPQSRPR